MNFLPRLRKRPKMGVRVSDKVVSPGHCAWVRSRYECAIASKHTCIGPVEAHHVESRGAGGDDSQVVPLCSGAHQDGHTIGWTTFAKTYSVDLERLANLLWQASPHRLKWELKQKQTKD